MSIKTVFIAIGGVLALIVGVLLGRGRTNRRAVADIQSGISELEKSNRDNQERAGRIKESGERIADAGGRIDSAADSAEQSIDRLEQLIEDVENGQSD